MSPAALPHLALKLPAWRSRLLLVLLLAWFVVLAGRALFLQGLHNDFLQQKGESRYGRAIELSATRGRIVDRNNEQLAISTPVESVAASPADVEMTAEQAKDIEAMTEADIAAAQFGQLAAVSTLATWSPDPTDDGFLKVYTGLKPDGTIDPLVNQRLAANSPVVLVPQYLPALNSLEAFAMDIGDKDFLLQGNAAFCAELDRFGVKYDFELYEGDHGNRIAERIRTEVLPFFGQHLDK